MKMFGKIVTICMFLVLASTLVSSQSQCGVCMDNFALCVNETSYQLCYESTTLATADQEIYSCPDNKYCTDSENICEAYPDGVNIKAVCAGQEDSTACSSTCSGKTNGQLICLSSTQFGICRGSTTLVPTSPLSCPTDQVCSEELVSELSLKKVCAPQSVLDYFELKSTCSNENAVTQATTTASTLSTTTVNALGLCESSGKTGSYFQIENPDNCQSYIYCQRDGTSYISMVLQCKAGLFYSVAQNKCITGVQCPQ
uniref:Chitin-binding type-2 domain-containing protein n=1 Tax=Bactrocera dorsalis TaxID=27457 RepID=A0A034WJR3_BACDO